MDEQQARFRAARRAFISTHHPDRGGDPNAFIAGLAAFETEITAPDAPLRVSVIARRTMWQRIADRVTRWRRPPPPRVR